MASAAGLERLELPPEWADDDVPHDVEVLVGDAEREARELEGGAFVASDYRLAWQVLRRLRSEGVLRPGARFLEWGSGQGMVAILAALLGFEAEGVELDARLVAASRRLAARYGAGGRARFVHGSYERIPGQNGLPVVDARGADAVYAYPWPGEEEAFRCRFAASARPGALLLLALGPLDMELWRMPGGRAGKNRVPMIGKTGETGFQ